MFGDDLGRQLGCTLISLARCTVSRLALVLAYDASWTGLRLRVAHWSGKKARLVDASDQLESDHAGGCEAREKTSAVQPGLSTMEAHLLDNAARTLRGLRAWTCINPIYRSGRARCAGNSGGTRVGAVDRQRRKLRLHWIVPWGNDRDRRLHLPSRTQWPSAVQ